MSTEEIIEAKRRMGPKYDPAIAASAIDVERAERERRVAVYAKCVEAGQPIEFVKCDTQPRGKTYWQDWRTV
jgi:hypothetical protein